MSKYNEQHATTMLNALIGTDTLADNDKQIRDEVIEQCMDVVPFRIDDGDYSDGFNACSKKY